jgi:hypothetical protein
MNRALPETYRPPLGLPLRWQDEESGALPAAVRAYFEHQTGKGPAPDPEALELLRAYLSYYLYAPCWLDASGGEALAALRRDAADLSTPAQIAVWIGRCLDLGIDPL